MPPSLARWPVGSDEPRWRNRGASPASWTSMPKSIMLQSTCACPWACMSPPIRPKLSQGLPSLVTKPGMIVWNGRLCGSRRLACDSVEGEQAAAVLEREAEVARDVVRAEPVEVALDQADAVAVLVDDRHVDRVGLAGLARRRAGRWPGRGRIRRPGVAAYALEISAATGTLANSGSA